MTYLTITHTLSLPSSFAPPPSASPSIDTLSYPLDNSSPTSQLESLEKQLGEARNAMNDRLTEWKDLLKDYEKDETKKNEKNNKKSVDEEEEEEEGEEDEE
ncbi:hypothetical protein JCM16303_005521 [Sporobolomyces ruberrimus]